MNRSYQRSCEQIRPTSIESNVNNYAEGSALIKCGSTHVLATASIENKVPSFLQHTKQGWITAEYGMLPRSTSTRMRREASAGKQSGRTIEIQRLIGRSLRAAVNLELLENKTITIDCDVIQADGGTRVASINAGYVALALALKSINLQDALQHQIIAISTGIINDRAMVDLDYHEDSHAQTDMNIVMTTAEDFIEIQSTAEKKPFNTKQFQQMMSYAISNIQKLSHIQNQALK